LQLYYAKGAITPRQGCNHSHAWFSNCFVFAIVEHQWLQPHCNLLSNQPYFSPGCNHIKQTLTTSCSSFLFFSKHTYAAVANHTRTYACNYTAIRAQAITYILVLQLSFFCNCCTSAVATTCKGCCNHMYFFTRLPPHQANTNLVAIWQFHGMELFFELVFLHPHFFLPVFFATIFFAIAVTCFFRNCFF
jgi:hypothetical protein